MTGHARLLSVYIQELQCDVSVEEDSRQEWTFTLYDFDNNGKVTREVSVPAGPPARPHPRRRTLCRAPTPVGPSPLLRADGEGRSEAPGSFMETSEKGEATERKGRQAALGTIRLGRGKRQAQGPRPP